MSFDIKNFVDMSQLSGQWNQQGYNVNNITDDINYTVHLAINYEDHKKVAISTGTGAIAALVALVAFVALAILFPVLGIPFLIGTVVAGATLLALGTTSVVYG